jgi:hypothetical protein
MLPSSFAFCSPFLRYKIQPSVCFHHPVSLLESLTCFEISNLGHACSRIYYHLDAYRPTPHNKPKALGSRRLRVWRYCVDVGTDAMLRRPVGGQAVDMDPVGPDVRLFIARFQPDCPACKQHSFLVSKTRFGLGKSRTARVSTPLFKDAAG